MIDIQQKEACCGCNACVQRCPQRCIAMQADDEGFLYPQVDASKCIECGLCEQVCPVIHQDEPQRPLGVFAAKNPDEGIRMESSSGGIFTMLAEFVLAKCGVVFGVRFDDRWEAIHDYTESVEGLAAFRGSKYMQSRIGDTFAQTADFLKAGRWVLFSGTPCQIAGLTRFLGRKYERLLTVDLVCHGVPSPMVWRDYLCERLRPEERTGKNTVLSPLNGMSALSGISFRDKSTGWKGSSLSIRRVSGAEISETGRQSTFMRGFLKDLYLRPSCYACPARSGKSRSDITIADYWSIGRWLPEFDDDKGVGLVMVNTSKGADVYAGLGAESIETTYEQALAGNSCMEKSVRIPKYRELFWQKYRRQGVSAIAEVCREMRPPAWKRVAHKVKLLLKRIIRRK